MNSKVISIVVPVFNEHENILPLYNAFRDAWVSLPNYAYELIFIDDGSTDTSVQEINALCAINPNVRCIEFSRNFGKEMATTAGLHEATGDAVIMLDADLQHPPKYIPQMISLWEGGAEVVVGVRSTNAGEGMVKKWGSLFYYKIMRAIADIEFEHGETDFRLLDRAVIEAFKNFPEHERMTRSLVNWLGFRREKIYFEAAAREHGVAAYSVFKLVRLAVNSFLSHSLLPLRLAGYLGVAIAIFSGFLGVAVILDKYIFRDPFGLSISGSAQLAILIVFLVGILLASIGIIGLYVGSIHVEVSNRPLYVIRRPHPKLKDKS